MNILFLTILKIDDINDRGIYPDLLRKFSHEGHNVYIITPSERKQIRKSALVRKDNVNILKVRTLLLRRTNPIGKWLYNYILGWQYFIVIKKHFPKVRFDLILYSTPPITFSNLVRYIKQKHGAISYLLLKDIFPQNAVDLGLIRQGGLLHRYMRILEKKLYAISDYIGCMSPANVEYLHKNNPEINPIKIEINPNSHELFEEPVTEFMKTQTRLKYGIPPDATLFIYGGNLGKPQGIDFVVDFLKSQKGRNECYFLIVGSGTDYNKIELWLSKEKPENVRLIPEMVKKEYNELLRSCDVGMIFLDQRFTIPNFPSRLLSYLEYRLPVLAATDRNTDLGEILEKNHFGIWSESGDIQTINQNVRKLSSDPDLRSEMGKNGYRYFLNNYTVDHSYNIIMKHFENYL